MPLIQVRVIKDVFSKEQKRQMISKLTDAMVSIEGEKHAQCHLVRGRGGRKRRLGNRRQCLDHSGRARSGARKGCLTARPSRRTICARSTDGVSGASYARRE
jgi:Tautomerase enzyme